MDLEHHFHEAMLQLYRDVVEAGIDYRPTLLLQQIHRIGGLSEAKRILQLPNVTDGFERLWSAGRLDLSVEHLCLREQWRQLFTREELMVAEHRLGMDRPAS